MRISRPSLFVDETKVRKNINRIAKKAQASSTELWPHFKTHQSLCIGDWFHDYGIDSITVSSVTMAKYFANGGWRDIYVAFPININEINDINALAEKVNLTLLTNEAVQITELASEVKTGVKVKIEIETGSRRSGVPATDFQTIEELLNMLKDSPHKFDGFYSHFGHTYKASNVEEVNSIFATSFSMLNELKDNFSDHNPSVSLGDTPSASVLPAFDHIKSVHAGNYVFYDLTQAQIGVCQEEDIAIALAVPIVSKNKERNELIVYGGGIHLSKESITSQEFERQIFGKIVEIEKSGWSKTLPGCYVSSLSQEHGVVQVDKAVFERLKVGDSIGILPVHSCMTADCMAEYHSFDGGVIDHLQGVNKNYSSGK